MNPQPSDPQSDASFIEALSNALISKGIEAMKSWVPQRCCQLFVVLNPIFRSIPPPLGVAGSLRLAEEHHEVFCEAVRATDAGKAAARIAAIEIALHDLLDDRPEKTVLPLEMGLILSREPVEMMRQHPVEDGPLRMLRTIDSRHSKRIASRNGLISRIGSRLPGKTR